LKIFFTVCFSIYTCLALWSTKCPRQAQITHTSQLLELTWSHFIFGPDYHY